MKSKSGPALSQKQRAAERRKKVRFVTCPGLASIDFLSIRPDCAQLRLSKQIQILAARKVEMMAEVGFGRNKQRFFHTRCLRYLVQYFQARARSEQQMLLDDNDAAPSLEPQSSSSSSFAGAQQQQQQQPQLPSTNPTVAMTSSSTATHFFASAASTVTIKPPSTACGGDAAWNDPPTATTTSNANNTSTTYAASTPLSSVKATKSSGGGSAALRTSIVDSLARQLDPHLALSLSRVLLRLCHVCVCVCVCVWCALCLCCFAHFFFFFFFCFVLVGCSHSLARQPSLVDECVSAARSPNLSGIELREHSRVRCLSSNRDRSFLNRHADRSIVVGVVTAVGDRDSGDARCIVALPAAA
jgi:hypothetical protein